MDTLKMHSLDGVQRNIEMIGKLFPNAITEVKRDGKVEHAIDFDVLRQELSDSIVEGREERYQFTWPDKKKAMLAANAPITATLRPVVADSVGKDGTPGGFDSENLYIEGDNLEVLKLLQETYLGKVKMIYIDPPYNTGNDFVYEDDFAQSADEYMGNSGQYDEEGNRLVTNTESNGRFHTDWLNMLYPRLRLAKDFLSDDGVIFISIDDSELRNVLKIGDEVFGNANFVACLTRVAKTTSFRGNYFVPSKDYIVAYCKNIVLLPAFQDEVTNDEQFKKIETDGPRKGEYYRDDIAFYLSTLQTRPNQRYFIECPDGELVVPPGETIPGIKKDGEKVLPHDGDGVWRWEQKQYLAKKDLLSFKQTKTSPLLNQNGERAKWNIYTKSYLNDKKEKGSIPRDFLESFLNRNGSEELKKLDIPFSFPKPSSLIKYLIKILNADKDIIVMDFFSGSATTAHAVIRLNAEDGGNRKFIMVQLPEKTDEKSEAYKAGYKNICEIGKERIRRAGKKIMEEAGLTAPADLDIGFRCLRLDDSNMKPVYYTPEEVSQQDMFSLVDNVKEDRTPEDLLFQVMLDLGVLLSSPIEATEIAGKKVFNVADGFLLACFDHDVTEETVKAIAQIKPYYAVFRDSSMANDSVATNFDQIFETYSPETVRKVL